MIKTKNIPLKLFKTFILILFCVLIFTTHKITAFCYNSPEELRESYATSYIESGSPNDSDYLKLTTIGKGIQITFRHSQSYSRISPRLIDYNTGKIVKGSAKYIRDSAKGGQTTNYSYSTSTISDGEYYFRIATDVPENLQSGLIQYPTLFFGIKLSIRDGYPTFYEYKNIERSNTELTNSVSPIFYSSTDLADLRYQLFKTYYDKSVRKIESATESNYYKEVSDSIVKDCKTDREKLKAIFAFVASNFYYDYNTTSVRTPYDDPYHNLKFFMTHTGNNYNAENGNVALHCDGYAGIVVALARAQGIPSRMVYGRKIQPGKRSWETTSDALFSSSSHTWA